MSEEEEFQRLVLDRLKRQGEAIVGLAALVLLLVLYLWVIS
jgi:hypothetical protein